MDLKLSDFEKNMVAASFAEAGDFKTARNMLVTEKKAGGAAHSANVLKACVWGLASAGLFALLFLNEDLVTDLYTRGKWFAAFPIATVFVFSFVHGSFANYFLTSLGLTPKGKK